MYYDTKFSRQSFPREDKVSLENGPGYCPLGYIDSYVAMYAYAYKNCFQGVSFSIDSISVCMCMHSTQK